MNAQRTLVFALVAVLLLLGAACSSTTSTTPPSTPASSTVDPYALEGADAEFVDDLRAKGLIPAVKAEWPDSAYVTDANAICQGLNFPGESAAVKREDLINRQENRVELYGITVDQATQVMILSVEAYCPDQVAVVERALSAS